MGVNPDESLLSTASTLIDSCLASLNASFDDEPDEPDQIENAKETTTGILKPSLFRGRITSPETVRNTSKHVSISSPTTAAVDLEIVDSATVGSHTTTSSKLDLLRARTRRLRKQSARRLEESRASLRKSRTLASESLPTLSPPPQQPQGPSTGLSRGINSIPEMELPTLIQRSDSVIDRLSSEIAMAGNIINQSYDSDAPFVDTPVKRNTNEFASDIYPKIKYAYHQDRDDKSESIIHNEENSVHNISIFDEWDQSTISATFHDPSVSSKSRENSAKVPQGRPMNSSGLPPPEVVVRRRTPVVSNRRIPSSRPSVSDRHLRQGASSVASSRGECASMYNSNQKCEKLAIENDCLKRQLDLLESRHRDSERKLVEQLRRIGDRSTLEQLQRRRLGGDRSVSTREERQPGTVVSFTSKTSISNFYDRKKKKKNARRRFVMVMLLSLFLLSSIVWLFRSTRSASPSAPNTLLGETVSSDNNNGARKKDNRKKREDRKKKGDRKKKENNPIDDVDDQPIIEEVPVVYQKAHNEKRKKSRSDKKTINRIKRFFSRIKIGNDQDPTGVWLKKHQQINTIKYHSEL